MDDAGDTGATEDGDMMEAEGADEGSADGESPNPDMAGKMPVIRLIAKLRIFEQNLTRWCRPMSCAISKSWTDFVPCLTGIWKMLPRCW